jgi:diguanylate cyclase (GGDEF)-like protein
MSIYAIIPVIAIIAYIPLLVTMIGTRPWSRQHRLFVLFLGTAIFWSLADYIFRNNFFPAYSEIIFRVILFAFILMAVQFHCFTSSFFPPDKGRWLPFAYGSLVVITILLALNYLPEGVRVSGDRLYPVYGRSVIILAIPLVTLLARNVYIFSLRIRKQQNPVIYNQTFTLLLSLGMLTVFVIAAILPFGREIPLSHIGNIINAIILSYAVVGHHLIDIREVLRRGLIWFSIILIALIGYWVLLYAFHLLFKINFTLIAMFASSLAALIVAALIYRFRDIISSALGQALQGQIYYPRQKLKAFSNQIHYLFSFKEQAGSLLQLIVQSTGCQSAVLLFLDSNTDDYVVQVVEPEEKANSFSGFRLNRDHPVVTFLQREKKYLLAEQLQILPEFLSLTSQEKAEIIQNNAGLFLPLISRGRLIGILLLGKKQNGIYTLEDFSLLEEIASRVAISMEKEYLREQLKEREEELSIINRSSAIITSSLDIQRIYDNFIQELKRVIDVDWAAITLIEGEELYFLAISSGVGSAWQVGERIPLRGTGTEWVANHKKAMVDYDLSVEARFTTGKYHLQHGIRSIAYVPLIVSSTVIGSLIVASRNPMAYNQRQLKLLEQLASQIAMPIENARLYARAERLARVDELTGLLNRRSLDELLPSEIGRHSRYGGIFSLIIMDLDSFKSFNDNYGHLVGDALLRQVGSIMKHTIREADQAFRYGGDEFAILLPHTGVDSAIKVAERIRQQIISRVEIASSPITMSLGIASWPADGISPEEIISAADAALYRAKRAGGNRTECAAGSLAMEQRGLSYINPEDSSTLSNIFALAATVDARDHYTRTHSRKVHEYALAIASALGLNELEINRLGTCALLDDSGKFGISDEILNKQGKLSNQEWEAVKAHPYLGAAIASHASQLAPCVSGILHHHEKYDGTGYPDGLRGEEIPLESRILAIADAFAAMTHPRTYSRALSYAEAIEEIRKGAGTQFDPKLVEVFLSVVPKIIQSQEQQDKADDTKYERDLTK